MVEAMNLFLNCIKFGVEGLFLEHNFSNFRLENVETLSSKN